MFLPRDMSFLLIVTHFLLEAWTEGEPQGNRSHVGLVVIHQTCHHCSHSSFLTSSSYCSSFILSGSTWKAAVFIPSKNLSTVQACSYWQEPTTCRWKKRASSMDTVNPHFRVGEVERAAGVWWWGSWFPVKASEVVEMEIGLLRQFEDQCVSGL